MVDSAQNCMDVDWQNKSVEQYNSVCHVAFRCAVVEQSDAFSVFSFCIHFGKNM